MKARPVPDDDDGGGLDSLLDTMTNVVGILVMVLIATQLGVKDAVKRIAVDEKVTAASLDAAREKLAVTREQREAIQSQLESLKPVDAKQVEVQLADLRRQMDETRNTLTIEEDVSNRFAIKIEEDKKKAEAAKKKVEDAKNAEEQQKKLSAELTTALAEESKIKALLDDTPVQSAPPPKIVTLPDPRPAPEGAKPVYFLCTNNRVYPLAADDWRATIRKKAEYVVKAKRLDGGPAVGVDKERFMKEFKRLNRSLRDEFFEIELYASGIYPRLRFIPRENAGATEDEVANPRSRFQRILKSVDRSKYYARFIVLPDSFEVYMTAREVVSKMGMLAGWDPQSEQYEFTTWIGGPTLFGPKPPPKPKAPPAKPANVID